MAYLLGTQSPQFFNLRTDPKRRKEIEVWNKVLEEATQKHAEEVAAAGSASGAAGSALPITIPSQVLPADGVATDEEEAQDTDPPPAAVGANIRALSQRAAKRRKQQKKKKQVPTEHRKEQKALRQHARHTHRYDNDTEYVRTVSAKGGTRQQSQMLTVWPREYGRPIRYHLPSTVRKAYIIVKRWANHRAAVLDKRCVIPTTLTYPREISDMGLVIMWITTQYDKTGRWGPWELYDWKTNNLGPADDITDDWPEDHKNRYNQDLYLKGKAAYEIYGRCVDFPTTDKDMAAMDEARYRTECKRQIHTAASRTFQQWRNHERAEEMAKTGSTLGAAGLGASAGNRRKRPLTLCPAGDITNWDPVSDPWEGMTAEERDNYLSHSLSEDDAELVRAAMTDKPEEPVIGQRPRTGVTIIPSRPSQPQPKRQRVGSRNPERGSASGATTWQESSWEQWRGYRGDYRERSRERAAESRSSRSSQWRPGDDDEGFRGSHYGQASSSTPSQQSKWTWDNRSRDRRRG